MPFVAGACWSLQSERRSTLYAGSRRRPVWQFDREWQRGRCRKASIIFKMASGGRCRDPVLQVRRAMVRPEGPPTTSCSMASAADIHGRSVAQPQPWHVARRVGVLTRWGRVRRPHRVGSGSAVCTGTARTLCWSPVSAEDSSGDVLSPGEATSPEVEFLNYRPCMHGCDRVGSEYSEICTVLASASGRWLINAWGRMYLLCV
jgi:hypothetical protein